MAWSESRIGRTTGGIAILSACLFLAQALCWPGGASLAAEPPRHGVPLRLGLAMQPTNALVMIGLKRGFFTDEGFNVQVVKFVSGAQALIKGLFAGKIDMVTASDVPIAISAFRRQDFKIVATVYSVDNQNRIIARRDHGIGKPADLKGKRLATQKNSAVHFFMSLYLANHGLSEKNVAISFLKAADLPAALVKGSIDAFAMREPYVSQAKDLLGDNAVVFQDPGLYDQSDHVVAADAYFESHPGSAAKIVRVLLDAEAFAKSNPKGAQSIVANFLDVDPGVIAANWPKRPPRVSLDQTLLSRLEGEARWAIHNKLVAEKTVPNYLRLINMRGLSAVKPEAITVVR